MEAGEGHYVGSVCIGEESVEFDRWEYFVLATEFQY